MKEKLEKYFTMKFLEKTYLDDFKQAKWMIYDSCNEIPLLNVGSSNQKLNITLDLDSKITFILDKEVQNPFDEDICKYLIPKSELKVSLDEFDRMMSQWDFIMSFPEILKIKPLTPAEMYISLINENPTENLTHWKIFVAFLLRFIFYSQWGLKNPLVATFKQMKLEDQCLAWLEILKLQVSLKFIHI